MVRDVEKRCSKLSGHFDHLKAESFSREAKLTVRGIVLSSTELCPQSSLVRESPETLTDTISSYMELVQQGPTSMRGLYVLFGHRRKY